MAFGVLDIKVGIREYVFLIQISHFDNTGKSVHVSADEVRHLLILCDDNDLMDVERPGIIADRVADIRRIGDQEDIDPLLCHGVLDLAKSLHILIF